MGRAELLHHRPALRRHLVRAAGPPLGLPTPVFPTGSRCRAASNNRAKGAAARALASLCARAARRSTSCRSRSARVEGLAGAAPPFLRRSLGCTLYAACYGMSPFEYSIGQAGGSIALSIMSGASGRAALPRSCCAGGGAPHGSTRICATLFSRDGHRESEVAERRALSAAVQRAGGSAAHT